MLLDLIKHHWRYHRTITITYLGYLILLLTVINSQNVLSFSAYYADYYAFLDEHPVDNFFFGTLKPGTLDKTDIEEELEILEIRRSFAKQGIVVYHSLTDVNLSLLSSDNRSNITSSQQLTGITVGATLPEVFKDLRELDVYKGEDLQAINESFISRALAYRIGVNGTQLLNFNLSILTGSSWLINTSNTFSWYAPESAVSHANIHFFVPLDVFLEWFASETIKVSVMVQHNREFLYSPHTPQKNLNVARNTRYTPSAFDFETGVITSSSTIESFFQSNRNPYVVSDLSLVFMIPPVILGLIFGSLLTSLWYKQYLKVWNYFKPRGLSYNSFLVSYLIYAGCLAVIAVPFAALIADIMENIILIAGFGSRSAFWFASFPHHIPFSMIIALIVTLWSKWRGVKKVQPFTVEETGQEILREENPYPWAITVSGLGLTGICLPMIIKSGFFQFSNLSLSLEIWFGLLLVIFTVVTPVAIIIGTGALLARILPAFKQLVNDILPRLHLTGIKSVMGFNRQRLAFFIVVAFAFQLFLSLGAINTPHIYYTISYNVIGAEYATDYMLIDDNAARTLEKAVLLDLEEVKETWKNTLITGFSYDAGSRVELYRYNVTSMPVRYKIPQKTKSLLIKASEEQKGIILATGKDYNAKNIIIKLGTGQNVDFQLVNEKVTLPGFMKEEGMEYSSDLIFVPSPSAIQLLIPVTVNLTGHYFKEYSRIQFFSDDQSNNRVKSKIESIASQQLGAWIGVNYPEKSIEQQPVFYIAETFFFSILVSISFIIIFVSELSARKTEFGPYLCRGFSFGMLRTALLVEATAVVLVSAVFSWLVANLLVLWLALMLQYGSMNPFVSPVFPLEIQLTFLAMVVSFIMFYYLILMIKIKSGNLLPYLKQSY